MSAEDETVTPSAAGRHAAESLAVLPAAALDPSVTCAAIDDLRAVVHVPVGNDVHEVTVTVEPTGQLRQLEMKRWGTPPGGVFGCYPFGASFDAEQWDDSRFIRYQLTEVRFC